MLCPMKSGSYHIKNKMEFGECEYSDCAWWDYDNQECSILSISRRLNNLYNK